MLKSSGALFSASIYCSLLSGNWYIVGQILHDLLVAELQKVVQVVNCSLQGPAGYSLTVYFYGFYLD